MHMLIRRLFLPLALLAAGFIVINTLPSKRERVSTDHQQRPARPGTAAARWAKYYHALGGQKPTGLWGDVPATGAENIWHWLSKQKETAAPGGRRLSWGALKEQGAKASVWTNLRDDRRYFTTRLSAGFTNQFIMVANTIYIAYLSGRIPILSPFGVNKHTGFDDTDLAVSDVFDLRRLSLLLDRLPIVELHELKDAAGRPERMRNAVYDGEIEQHDAHGRLLGLGEQIPSEPPNEETMGCWSWFQAQNKSGGDWKSHHDFHWKGRPIMELVALPRHSFLESNIGEGGSSMDMLAKFLENPPAYPDEDSLQTMEKFSLPIPDVLPDPRLACLDLVYFYHVEPKRFGIIDEWRAGQGVWQAVGKHMRFQPGLVRLAEGYLRHAFGVAQGQPIPPYMAVHVRRDDFPQFWLELPPDYFAHAAWEVLLTIKEGLGIHIQHIILTTDNSEPGWTDPFVSYGWHLVNHTATNTVERFGEWMPTLLDIVMLGSAKGFLGNPGSTMSTLAMRRVIDWQDGVGKMIDWNHQIPEGWTWTW